MPMYSTILVHCNLLQSQDNMIERNRGNYSIVIHPQGKELYSRDGLGERGGLQVAYLIFPHGEGSPQRFKAHDDTA